jgi:hypothetical protein
MNKLLTLLLVASTLNACTWVKPTTKSHEIVLKESSQVVNCVKKGVTNSKSLSKIAFVPRNQEKIFNELVLLAKNEAVILKGDTIVAEGKMDKGQQTFGVYLCN